MISQGLLALVRCPACHGTLSGEPSALTCQLCGKQYGGPSKDFLDLRPHEDFQEQTKYLVLFKDNPEMLRLLFPAAQP